MRTLKLNNLKETAEQIDKAAYYIPGEYLQDCSTGMAYVYSRGLTAGRLQALEILTNNE
jgi:hypothetical protein